MAAVLVLSVWFGLRLVLNTEYPVLAVDSGSMCVSGNGVCDGWSHPFEPTLHVGDLVILEGVDPQTLNTTYPYSDIIVYRNPSDKTLIVHRIVDAQEIDGTLYFKTKGDGNGPIVWPNIPYYFDDIPDQHGVPADLIIGRVVMRIPLLGWVPLFVENNPFGVPLLILVVALAGFVLLVLPQMKKKKQLNQQHDFQGQV